MEMEMATLIHVCKRRLIKYQQFHAPTQLKSEWINPVAHQCMVVAMDFYQEERAATQMDCMKMLTFNLRPAL